MNKNKDNLSKLTENSRNVLLNAYNLAQDSKSPEVTLEHVFISLLSLDKGLAARFLRSMGIDLAQTIESIKAKVKAGKRKQKEVMVSESVKELIKTAFQIAANLSHVY